MSSTPTSHFLTLKNRPIVQENGEIAQGPLKLHYWEWKGHGPTVLFTHGVSFHGRCYDRIINETLSGFHVISLDFRGHGRSQKHPPPYKLPWYGEDLLHLIEALDLHKNNLIGIGHSLGGYSLILAAAIASKRLFQSLILFDPIILPEFMYGTAIDYSAISRRKNQWSSIEDMISYMEKRKAFSKWSKDTLRDYCTYALDENFKLQCTPDNEASMYQMGIENESNIYPLIKNSKFIQDIPIHIIRASTSDELNMGEASLAAPDLVKWFKKGRDMQLENAHHLFPLEEPEITIDIVKELIKEYKQPRSHL
jgi:pimeloyl-ACP methyl ester carboxylesterase